MEADPLPLTLVAGVIGQEDHLFFDHLGISLLNLTIITKRFLKTGSFPRGGSTIDMQVVSLCYGFTSEAKAKQSAVVKIVRKVHELYWAIPLNIYSTKQDILWTYLSKVDLMPSGEENKPKKTGFAAASYFYFHLPPSKLNESQQWSLIATLRNRDLFNPNNVKNIEGLPKEIYWSVLRAKEREKEILTNYKSELSSLRFIKSENI